MGDCGVRCLSERKTHCRELQKWSRNLLSLLDEVNSCFPRLDDWNPLEKCFVCRDRSLAVTENRKLDCSGPLKALEKKEAVHSFAVQAKSNLEKKSTLLNKSTDKISDARPETSAKKGLSSHREDSNLSLLFSSAPQQTFLQNEEAQQTAVNNLLRWSFAEMQPAFLAAQQIASGGLLLRECYNAISKLQASLGVKENGDIKTGSIPGCGLTEFQSSATSLDCGQPGFPLNSPLSACASIAAKNCFTGLAEGLYGSSSPLVCDFSIDQEEPLDLSSKTSLQVATRNAVALRKARDFKNLDLSSTFAQTSDPLSLAFCMPNMFSGEDTFSSALMASSLRKPARKLSAKRSYSQTDLDAAVKDIRSGLLGTRRASVVYGIPRSTLRNKIYKLEAAEALSGEPSCSKRRRYGSQQSANSSLKNVEQRKREVKLSFDALQESQAEEVNLLKTMKELESKRLGQKVSLEQDVGTGGGKSSGDCAKSFKPEEWLRKTSSTITLDVPQSSSESLIEQKSENHSPSSSVGIKGEKRPRPKRGQYRKYEKETLEEAVRSVRRGEMSVHRAGSYYGVPHSTLEYKVKERNLDRPKKYQDSIESSSPEAGNFSKQDCDGSSSPTTPVAAMFADPSENEIVGSKTMAAIGNF